MTGLPGKFGILTKQLLVTEITSIWLGFPNQKILKKTIVELAPRNIGVICYELMGYGPCHFGGDRILRHYCHLYL